MRAAWHEMAWNSFFIRHLFLFCLGRGRTRWREEPISGRVGIVSVNLVLIAVKLFVFCQYPAHELNVQIRYDNLLSVWL